MEKRAHNRLSRTDSIGRRLKLLREQQGLTQEDLAQTVGVSRSAVAQWETDRGNQFSLNISAVAKALSVPDEAFLNGLAETNLSELLTLDEAALLTNYRRCDVSRRIALLRSAERSASQKKI